MELKTTYIHMNREKGRALSQITLDDDYNLPDYKPDIVKVMKEKGEIQFEEVKVSEGHILVQGALKFWILYRSDQDEKKLDCLTGSIPFTETISLEGAEELDPVQMSAKVEDLSIEIINSRKLGVRALVMLQALIRQSGDEEIATDVVAQQPLEMQREQQEVLGLLECKKDNFRFRQEISLPSSKPNIRDILWKSVQLRGFESRLAEGRIELSGELLVYVLYMGEEDQERMQWIETTLPLTGSLECTGCSPDLIYRIIARPRTVELEVKPDFDGEMRTLNLDMVLDLDICLWKEETIEILKDVYSLSGEIVPEYKECSLPRLIAKNYAKCKVTDRIGLQSEQENILQICVCEGTAALEQVTFEAGGVKAEGTIEVELMYITTDDAMPVGTLKGLIAFEQKVEVPGADENSEFEVEAGLEQLEAVLVDNTQVEIKAVVNLNLIAFSNQSMQKLAAIEEREPNLEELQKSPGIVGYIVKAGDSLWKIAKENHTTISDLMQTNQLTAEEIREGDKLLIVKTI